MKKQKMMGLILFFLSFFVVGMLDVHAVTYTYKLGGEAQHSHYYFKVNGINLPYQASMGQMIGSDGNNYFAYCMDQGTNVSEGSVYEQQTLRSMRGSSRSNRNNMAKNESKVIAVMNNVYPYITLSEMNKRLNEYYGYTGSQKITLTTREAIASAQARFWQLSGVSGTYKVDTSRSSLESSNSANHIEKAIAWLKSLKEFEIDEPEVSIVSSSYKFDSSKDKFVATVKYKVNLKQTDGAKVTHKITNNANSSVDTYNRASGTYTYTKEFSKSVTSVRINIKVTNQIDNFRDVKVYLNNTWQDVVGSVASSEGDSGSTYVKLQGEEVPETAIYRVYKKDTAGRMVIGVEFNVKGEGRNLFCTTDEYGYCDFLGLKPGTYTLVEESVPSGYIKQTSEKTFTIKTSDLGNLVEDTVVNDYTKVQISKQDITTGKELPGAKLEIKDSTGKVIHSWISSDTPHYIEKLPLGKYTLVETVVPKGYKKLQSETPFEITNGTLVKMVISNAPTKIKISKKDLTTGEEVPGAHLQIKDSEGNIVAEWVSTNEPYYIEGLPLGKYTLTETIAPEGYKKSETEYPFEITNDNEVNIDVYNEYIVVDTPEENVQVPKTDSYNKNILYILGGTIVLGGIFLGVHTLKSKKA